jgi:integrase
MGYRTATVDTKLRKAGYVIRVKDKALGLDTTFQSLTQKKRIAEKQAEDVSSNLRRVKRGELSFGGDWSTLDKLYLLRTGHKPESQEKVRVKLQDAVDGYILSREDRKLAHNTLNLYRLHLAEIVKHFGNCQVEAIRRNQIQTWVTSQSKRKIVTGKHVGQMTDIKTVKKKVDSLKRLFRWLKQNGDYGGEFAPMFQNLEYPISGGDWDILDWETLAERQETLKREKLPADKRESFEKVYLSPEEVGRLLELAESKLSEGSPSQRRLFYALCFAAYTSARRSEIVRVRRRDIDFERGVVRLTIKKGRGDKPFRYLDFPIHSDLKPLLDEHMDEHKGEALFTSDDDHVVDSGFDEKEERSKASSLGNQLKDALIGTEFELCSGWHIYRHSFISAIGETLTPAQGMQLVGHHTESVHLRYRHDANDASEKAAHLEALNYTSGVKSGTQVVRNGSGFAACD